MSLGQTSYASISAHDHFDTIPDGTIVVEGDTWRRFFRDYNRALEAFEIEKTASKAEGESRPLIAYRVAGKGEDQMTTRYRW